MAPLGCSWVPHLGSGLRRRQRQAPAKAAAVILSCTAADGWRKHQVIVARLNLARYVFVEATRGRTLIVSRLEHGARGNIVELHVPGVRRLVVGCPAAKAEN